MCTIFKLNYQFCSMILNVLRGGGQFDSIFSIITVCLYIFGLTELPSDI